MSQARVAQTCGRRDKPHGVSLRSLDHQRCGSVRLCWGSAGLATGSARSCCPTGAAYDLAVPRRAAVRAPPRRLHGLPGRVLLLGRRPGARGLAVRRVVAGSGRDARGSGRRGHAGGVGAGRAGAVGRADLSWDELQVKCADSWATCQHVF